MNLPVFFRALTVTGLLSLLVTVAAVAQPTTWDPHAGLLGFTPTGVLVGNQRSVVELPFSPTPRMDRAQLDSAALQRGEVSNIAIPTSDHVMELQPFTSNYLTPITPPTIVPTPFEQKWANKFLRFKKLSDRLSRIVNPHIRTKNWDITIQPMLPSI